MLKFKKAIIILISALFLSGCAGMSLFPNAPEFCTPEEQVDSIIYKYLDPATTDFALMLGTASYLEKHPEGAPALIKIIDAAKTLVEGGATYNIFADELMELLGPLQFVVVSPLLDSFKGVIIPINDCDKRMILGHLNKQLKLVQMIK